MGKPKQSSKNSAGATPLGGANGTIPLTIQFLSDWHVGEGAGRHGQIDRIVRRHPEDRLPYVPAKTLTGMLRDGCEKVACGLDDGKDGGPWQTFASALFGGQTGPGETPRPGVVHVGEARFSVPLRAALATEAGKKIAQSMVFVKPGVKLEMGIALEKHQRMEEVAVTGAILYAEIAFDDHIKGAWRPAAHALLWAGCRTLERLGGNRRRGTGRCLCTLGHQQEAFQDKFLGLLNEDPPALPDGNIAIGELAGWQSKPDEKWSVWTLEVMLEGPLLVPGRVAGNVVGCRDHIPGTLILAALNRHFNGKLSNRKLPALAAGDLQIRNGYLADNSRRLLPVPMSFFKLKQPSEGNKHLNLIRQDQTDDEQRNQCREGYVRPTDTGSITLTEVTRQFSTHAAVDDICQRPNEQTGGVYTYEAISMGQTFIAELWMRESLAKGFKETDINGHYRLGRSKKDEFGRVQITASRRPGTAQTIADTQEFTLWLVSPLLLRDKRLRPSTAPAVLEDALTNALGPEVSIARFHQRTHREDGWQTVWHAPRPSRIGFAAGSCFLVQAAQPIPGAKLKELQEGGFGERRGEGYGEIRIQAPILESFEVNLQEPSAPTSLAMPTTAWALAEEDNRFARKLVERHWREDLEIRARKSASDPQFRADELGMGNGKPSNGQMGNLRSFLENAHNDAGRERLCAWVMQMRTKSDTAWTKALKPLLSLLDSSVTTPVWDWLGIPETLPGIPAQELKAAFAKEALYLVWLAAIQTEVKFRARPAPDNTAEAAADTGSDTASPELADEVDAATPASEHGEDH